LKIQELSTWVSDLFSCYYIQSLMSARKSRWYLRIFICDDRQILSSAMLVGMISILHWSGSTLKK
jgi:hypothetical protein